MPNEPYFYTVIEVQQSLEGQFGTLVYHYDDYNEALSKFFAVCAAGVVSTIPYHSCHILRSDNYITDGHVFDRRNQMKVATTE